MEILYSNVEKTQPEDVPEPEPEEESVVAPEVRPSGPRPSILKVSARSRPSSVAGAIAGVVREVGRAEVQAIGAGATNQAVKAIAIARSYLQEDGIDIVCVPSFAEVIIEQEERTAIRLVVEKR
jgi:stage V sporulation protein S